MDRLRTACRRAIGALLLLVVLTPTVPAQESPAAAPAFQTPTAASRVRRVLKQREALVADGEWDEVIDLTEDLQLDLGNEWIGTSTPFDRKEAKQYETVASYCQRMLLMAPSEGLTAYRRRVDSIAERWLREGTERLDESLLRRITDELFASSYGDEALLALGELALQRGDTAAARRYWRRMDRRLWGPRGESIGVALADLDPEVDLDRLAEIWTKFPRPDDWLVYPDSDVPIADVLVRLCIASLREGDPARAAIELRLLEALAPEASGRLAGRVQPYAQALAEMIAAASSSDRQEDNQLGPLYAWAWPEPVASAKLKLNPQQQLAKRMAAQNQMARRRLLLNQQALLRQRGLALGGRWAIPPARAQTPPPQMAVASSRRVIFADAKGLRSIAIATGQIATILWPGDTEHEEPAKPAPAVAAQGGGNRILLNGVLNGVQGGQIVIRGGVRIQGGQVQWFGGRQGSRNPLLQPKILPHTLTLAGDVLYAVRSQLVTERTERRISRVQQETLVGLDLSSDAKLVFEIQGTKIEEEQRFRFAGPPTIHEDRLYLMLTDRDAPARLSVACFSTPHGRLLWRTPIGTGQPLVSMGEISRPVTLAGDTVYATTHLGAIVALDAANGRLRWLTRYERLPMGMTPMEPQASPCVVRGDRLYVAPMDSPAVLAIDTVTGRPLWSAPVPVGAASVVGVVGESLVLAGRRVASYDAATGQQRFVWPESDHAGIRGQGRALLAGNELFWPTRDRVFCLNPATGRFTRPAMNLGPLGSEGANLFRAGNQLVIAGPEKINLRGPMPSVQEEPQPGWSRLRKGPSPLEENLLVIDSQR